MLEAHAPRWWRPQPTILVAGGLVIAGFLLMGTSPWFLLLAAFGTFGPGVLREIGWLRDKDEFQRQAAHRAGYHAFLVAGLSAFAMVAFVRSGDRRLKNPEELATLFLAILWCTWFLSTLLAYWGPQKTAARILYAFGSAWLVFAIASNVGAEWSGWAALLLHPLLTVPFFGVAWMSQRWPRVGGVLLLAASLFFVWFFHLFQKEHVGLIADAMTFILFIGPLLASGVALLFTPAPAEEVD